jgi:orotidine-5'-phosphate decarboxylase
VDRDRAVNRDPAAPAADRERGARAASGALSRFGDRLARRVAERGSQLVLGLDPVPDRLWPRAIELAGAPGSSAATPSAQAALAVALHCALVLDAVAEECVAAKLQVACFERLGAPGWAALQEVATRARDVGLLVIADAKRGDIDVTASAYAAAFLGRTETPYGPVEGLGADALTVNPFLGADSLQPFVAAAREGGAGLFVLTRTSNPGAADLQQMKAEDGRSVSRHVAALVAELGEPGVGDAGLWDVGAVVGATAPDVLAELRAAMPRAVFLLPGVGAQGGRVEDLAPAFAPGPAGGLISASRSIVDAHEKMGGDGADAARREAAGLRELTWNVAS